LFKALKTIPPTSIEAERAFSTAGIFITKLRNRLSAKTINLYINLTLGAFCVFPYSSFIIGPNTSKFGMETLLDVPLGVRLCIIKKVNISLKNF
jgi:hypothetical protein